MNIISSETTTAWVRLGCPVVLSCLWDYESQPQLLCALGPICDRVREKQALVKNINFLVFTGFLIVHH